MSDFEFEDDINQAKQAKEEVREERAREERRSTRDQEQVFMGLNLADGFEQQRRTSIGSLNDVAMATITKVFETARDFESANLKESVRRKAFKLMPMNGAGSSQNPALIMTLPVAETKRTLAYVFIFEQPDSTQQTRPLVEGSEQYNCIMTPEDQATVQFVGRIQNLLATNEQNLVIVNFQTILQEVTSALTKGGEITPQVNKIVSDIVNNAIDALTYAHEVEQAALSGLKTTPVALTPGSIGDKDQLETVFEFPSTVSHDSSGLPTAPAVTATVFYTRKVRDEWENQEQVRERLGSVSASIDLYLDDQGYENANARSFGRRARKQVIEAEPFWQAVLEVRNISGAKGLPFSREQMLYQLAQIAHLTNDYKWVRTLTPRMVADGAGANSNIISPLVDLGVLNIYNPDEKEAGYIDNISYRTSEDELIGYLSQTVRPDIAVGLTLPNSGEKSWLTSIFERIALSESHNETEELVTRLYDSCNILTGGVFADVIANSQLDDPVFKPVISTGHKELIGVWQDSNGVSRPLSEWTVAAVASHFKDRNEAEDIVREYQMTFEGDGSNRSSEYWLSLRYDLLRRYVCDNLRVTGTATKMVIGAEFLGALSEAISMTRLDPYINNIGDINRARRAGSTSYGQYASNDLGHNRRRRHEETRRGGSRVYRNNFF